MADTDLDAQQGAEGLDASVTDAGALDAEQKNDTPSNDTPDPIAALAAEMGWKPKDQWQGSPEEWKPADDFIRSGRDITRGLSRELRGMREQVDRLGRTSAQILKDKITERDNYWKGIHAKAVEEGNAELAERAVTERMTLKQSAPQPGMPSETAEFIDRHRKWWDGDPLARTRAEEIAASLAQRGYDIPEQLKQVERAIKKEFPEHFAAPAKPPAAVQTAASRNPTTTSRVKGFADMPAESQKLALDYENRHGVKKETFAASYWADIEKTQRRGA